jgi:hypothetical protein
MFPGLQVLRPDALIPVAKRARRSLPCPVVVCDPHGAYGFVVLTGLWNAHGHDDERQIAELQSSGKASTTGYVSWDVESVAPFSAMVPFSDLSLRYRGPVCEFTGAGFGDESLGTDLVFWSETVPSPPRRVSPHWVHQTRLATSCPAGCERFEGVVVRVSGHLCMLLTEKAYYQRAPCLRSSGGPQTQRICDPSQGPTNVNWPVARSQTCKFVRHQVPKMNIGLGQFAFWDLVTGHFAFLGPCDGPIFIFGTL